MQCTGKFREALSSRLPKLARSYTFKPGLLRGTAESFPHVASAAPHSSPSILCSLPGLWAIVRATSRSSGRPSSPHAVAEGHDKWPNEPAKPRVQTRQPMANRQGMKALRRQCLDGVIVLFTVFFGAIRIYNLKTTPATCAILFERLYCSPCKCCFREACSTLTLH